MNRLQERRMVLGLTQPQVSARLKETEPRADVGMVSRYEKGVCLPTPDQLKAPGGCPGSVQDGTLRRGGPGPLGALPTAESRSEASETETAPPTAPTGRFRKVLPHQPRVRGKPAGRSAPGVRVFVLAKLA